MGANTRNKKLRFSEYLKYVSAADLPTEFDFYTQLKQHALSASVGRQVDAQGMASLHADFGAAGLVRFIGALPPRYGGLLFAHASLSDQLEAARLLSPTEVADLAEPLLWSNRMSAMEADHLISLLAGARSAAPLPPPPEATEISDLGSTFDAASALSILLGAMNLETQVHLLTRAKDRFGGTFPSWYQAIVWPDALLKLSDEARADLFYEIDVKNLAGWMAILPAPTREALLNGVSSTLRNAIRASTEFATPSAALESYRQGRLELAAALRRRLARASMSFENLVT